VLKKEKKTKKNEKKERTKEEEKNYVNETELQEQIKIVLN